MKKKYILWKSVAALIIAVFSVSSCQSPVMEEETFESDLVLKSASIGKVSYIVQLKDELAIQSLRGLKDYQSKNKEIKGLALGLLKRNNLDAELGYFYSNSIIGFSVKLPPGQAKKLLADQSVKSIHEDKIIRLAPPPKKEKPGNGNTTDPAPVTSAQETPWGITRVGGASDGIGKRAWIIDTGIDLDHEDLNVDASLGFSAFSKGKDASFDDGNGHGSHVSGTIAAKDNNLGVVGVAAGATVVPVKVLSSRGSGSYSGVIAGVDWVAAHGSNGDVANMSLGGPPYSDLDDAVVNASNNSGVIFVLAAGNESDDANNHSPARTNGPKVYTVSAMDSSDDYAYFSNYGNPPIDFCAPGVSVKSTYKDGGYRTLSGTSMAAPHVAGIALLGTVSTSGTVNGDPDNNPDPIAHQ
ncbi:S8 family peptidase [Sunxiuqinia sp. A32]|uniref:S8 family peptidase n=1 Tax=Sunxiuqinia sp. A32 TaxID=3461496 RepID=UPI0040467A69